MKNNGNQIDKERIEVEVEVEAESAAKQLDERHLPSIWPRAQLNSAQSKANQANPITQQHKHTQIQRQRQRQTEGQGAAKKYGNLSHHKMCERENFAPPFAASALASAS